MTRSSLHDDRCAPRRDGDRDTPDVVLAAARQYAQEGRESHVLWANHLRLHRNGSPCDACTDEVIATAGDLDEQLEWVRKYDVILLALELVDETLAVKAGRCGGAAR